MAGDGDHDPPLNGQRAYYRARAQEHDERFHRQGRYDRGVEPSRRWLEEIESARERPSAFRPEGNVLELACGTDLWTEQLLSHAARITAVDAAGEMPAINKASGESASTPTWSKTASRA
ncbi:MAG: class I SAM-dependent methyltransferase, partial [Vicinamibacteria bacterium]|nr:class I SAM-dependent methyltransferase [Vicinamibacteria bacterium]